MTDEGWEECDSCANDQLGTRNNVEKRSRQLQPAIASASGDINALVSLLTLDMPLPEGRGTDINVHFNRDVFNQLLRRDRRSTRAFWQILSALESEE
jgi:hypothetical protein